LGQLAQVPLLLFLSDGRAEFGDFVIINIVKKALLVFYVAVRDQ
jgi:hypothetical protein